ncbi:MAG: FtsQ-type POTRA domain-containing protein [Clostridia bacterium]|nr:FtsQ-type POTRA domain-containing protein [Clostridia bacterium]
MRKRRSDAQKFTGDLDWENAGYHMEEIPSDQAELVSPSNDTGYVMPSPRNVTSDWQNSAETANPHAERREMGFDQRLKRFIGRDDVLEEDWNTGSKGQNPETASAAQNTGTPAPPLRWDRSWRRVWLIAVLAVVILAAAGYSVALIMTRVDRITVEGNLLVPDEVVIQLSGLKTGESLLIIDQDELEKRIARSPYLTLIVAKRESLHTIALKVREREPAAYINVHGYLYVLDDRGMVLQEEPGSNGLQNLLRVASMDTKRCDVGHRINVYYEDQLNAYMEIMMEIKIQGLRSVVSEMYVGDLNNISLATYDGFSVHLGVNTEIHEKLRAMELVRQALIASGVSGGTIDVSDCENPTHIPEAAPV